MGAHRSSCCFLVAGISSRVADKPLGMLFKDDRLPLLLPDIDAKMAEQLNYIECLSDEVFQLLSKVTGHEWHSLRNHCICFAQSCVAYMCMRLRRARKRGMGVVTR